MSLAMAMVMAKPELVSGLSRNDAFVGYSELPATTKLYYGFISLNPHILVYSAASMEFVSRELEIGIRG